MRIVGVRVAQIAAVFAVLYAAGGVLTICLAAATHSAFLLVPFGIITPVFHATVNLTLGTSGTISSRVFECALTVVVYAASGWVTGAFVALCFNAVAKRMGGVEAKYFLTRNE